MSTGQAAEVCHVERDTVLKWIKCGKLPAERTAGGHYRIAWPELNRFLASRRRPGQSNQRPGPMAGRLRCWEYLATDGRIHQECRHCAVYRVQAARCFELLRLGCELGHRHLFCHGSCEDCAYYRRLTGLPTRVLVLTRRESLMQKLWHGEADDLEFRFARNAYEAARQVGEFRPAFVVVESANGGEALEELLDCLAADTRSPGMRIILATGRQRTPEQRRRLVAGFVPEDFEAADIRKAVAGVPVETDRERGRLDVLQPKFG